MTNFKDLDFLVESLRKVDTGKNHILITGNIKVGKITLLKAFIKKYYKNSKKELFLEIFCYNGRKLNKFFQGVYFHEKTNNHHALHLCNGRHSARFCIADLRL